MTTAPELPKDLVEEEILCRFPARNLVRFRSTCKTWNLLFNNQRFVTEHCNKAAKELLVLMVTNETKICPLSVNLDGIVPSVEVKSGLSLIDPRSNNSDQFDLSDVFHCDGFLLCTGTYLTSIVVWNPCNGETRWIETCNTKAARYVLGYSKSSSSGKKRYKVLSFSTYRKVSEIYDFSSDSWRILDHHITPAWYSVCGDSGHAVSLKGKTYWLASDQRDTHPGVYLLSFDFSSETSSLLVRLPYKCSTYETTSLSVVREEKLSVLLQREENSKTEIWVTNTIDGETKAVSWSLVLALDLSPDLQIEDLSSFLLDEEKKLALCCLRLIDIENDTMEDKIYCVGEDNKVTQVYWRADTMYSTGPAILNYVPSLAQIEPGGGNKRKRVFSEL